MIRTVELKFENKLSFIDNAPLQEFIDFAKNYNIFQNSNNKVYQIFCDKIKKRLDREGLSYETVRPD